MAEGGQDPYYYNRGYHAAGADFSTVKLEPPIRLQELGPVEVTSTFDRPPVRVVQSPPSATDQRTSNFDQAPVRLGPVKQQPPPPPPPPAAFNYVEEPVKNSTQTTPAPPPAVPSHSSPQNDAGRISSGDGLQAAHHQMTWWWLLSDIILRCLTFLCLVVSLPLLLDFLSKLKDYPHANIQLASPTYALAISIIGIVCTIVAVVIKVIGYFCRNAIFGDDKDILIFFIIDQIFVILYLTAGSIGASYLSARNCTLKEVCGKGAVGATMLLLAFAFNFGNIILSFVLVYKRRMKTT